MRQRKLYKVICKYYSDKRNEKDWTVKKNALISSEEYPELVRASSSFEAIMHLIKIYYSQLDGAITSHDHDKMIADFKRMISKGIVPDFTPPDIEFLEIKTNRRFTLKFEAKSIKESDAMVSLGTTPLFDLSLYGEGGGGYEDG